ncbi:hypothetical protein A2160_03010 [Candidatus Beckwithbacteria bacterium RBG_13_42_9]|uniref:Uncharacterized protein n=1 Tax=Candidatus Beckwithbacteria bacterium RBG_13_42_9 TaxID=1797457 RepID=A0A1F5E7Y5_9BACT|nr:MAG: hypothetical protein A2160_03010 [Candidatus Beckwithbacteria bacterium RBG_13_42_9]
MKQKNILKILAGLSLFFLGGFLFLVKVPLAENLFIHYGVNAYPLYQDFEIKQGFVPNRPKLLGFRFAFNKTNTNEHPVKIELSRETETSLGKVNLPLYLATFSTKNVETGQNYNFWLAPPLSTNKEKFWLRFFAPVSTESASLSPIISRVNNYLEGETYSSVRALDGDVVFQPIYETDIPHFVAYYLNKIAFGKPFFNNKFILLGLFTGWLIIFFGVQFFLILTLLKSRFNLKAAFLLIFTLILLGVILGYQSQFQFIFTKL